MKLAIVRQRYNPFGGAERFVERAAEALCRQGAAVTIISREWTGASGSATWLRCAPFYIGRLWRDSSFARAACRAASRGGFDLVQSHERIACCDIYRAGDGVHAQWLEHRAKRMSPAARRWMLLNPYHRYVLAAEKRLFASPRLRAVICNSRMVRSEIQRWFALDERKLHVIYNGVDLDAFHPRLRAEHRVAFRARLGISLSAPVILFVGSGFERKGVAVLLDAFARMPRKDARLVIVGKDGFQAKLEARARSLGLAGRVHWAGAQPDVRPWYGAADVFALPTAYDPFPNAVLEAMASGLPAVTTRNCGAAELVQDGKNGYVCHDPSDPDELCQRLSDAVEQSQRLGENARASAQGFGIDEMGAALLSLYRRLLDPNIAVAST
jgi:UDP-glucose:(heptosyl)LPS alpha-1,3-glucosyltransferase